MKKRTRTRITTLLAIILLLTFFTAACQKKTETPEVHGKTVSDMIGTVDQPDPIRYNGVLYEFREDVSSYLFLGIDNDTAEETGLQNTGGQADVLLLLVLDKAEKTYTLLQLNRDTICSVDTLGMGNEILGTASMQLCLSHTYGDGGEASAENTLRAVSRLLYETPIDGYMAVGMDAMPLLNDAVGGVTITLTEDFSAVDPAMTPGTTLTLTGDQAYAYLRYRFDIGDGTNLSRMQRHRTYLAAFMDKIQTDEVPLNTLYETVKPYSQTNITGAALNDLYAAAQDYTNQGILTPDGTTAVVDDLNEFYVNDDDLAALVLSLFYEECAESN